MTELKARRVPCGWCGERIKLFQTSETWNNGYKWLHQPTYEDEPYDKCWPTELATLSLFAVPPGNKPVVNLCQETLCTS